MSGVERRSLRAEAVAEVKARLDIVAVVGEYVSLKRQGRNYVGLCPFHQEKTPSFTVSPERQMFYCFGCGAGGDVFSFIMRLEQVGFGEALRRLAERAGVRLETPPARASAAAEEIYRANAAAQAVYHHLLCRHRLGQVARAYLQKRGLGPEDWERFGLGWAPEKSVVGPYLKRRGFAEELLLAAGLVARREDGKIYDRFRQRVIFPIYDRRGRVVGFGGRIVGDDPHRPKYLNSPETPVFHKGKVLYGLNWAQAEARRRGQIVVVEGYMDVLSAHRHGLTYVVASLGTALTAEQARLLRACAERVVTSFDADAAGSAATLRGLDVLRDAGCRVWVAPLPPGYDPDKLVAERGPQALERLWGEEAVPLIVYKLEQAKRRHALFSPEGKAAAAREVLPDIARLESPLERQEYVRWIAQELGTREEALWAELKKLVTKDKKAGSRDNKTGALLPAKPWRQRAEEELLALMLQDRRLCGEITAVLGWDFFTDERARKLACGLRQWLEEHKEGSPDVVALVEQLEDGEEVAALAYELMVRDRAAFASVEDNIRSIQIHRLQEEARELQERLRAAAGGESGELLARLAAVQRRLQELQGSQPPPGKGGNSR